MRSFSGGIHPLSWRHEGKTATHHQPIRDFITDTVTLPVDAHLAPASVPCVKKGERVLLGQLIATPTGPRGVPIHASVSGTVMAVESIQQLYPKPSVCITIQNDNLDEWVTLNPLGSVETAPADQIIPAIQAAGITGLGGASFPTFAKMSPPANKPIGEIILNAAECETFLTCDDRLMQEHPTRIVDGLRLAMRAMGIKSGVIAIEANKPLAIAAIKKAVNGREGVRVEVLKTKYPQGCEKQLITAITGREVPSGGLPMDVGVVVLNVGTAAAIADAVIEGKPVISRITTVTGAVRKPSNLRVRIGTVFADAIGACDGTIGTPGKILAGGTMTGTCAPDDNVSITKATNGIVVLTEAEAKSPGETDCILCGRCIAACPTRLNPCQLGNLCAASDLEGAKKAHVMDCIVCGSCSYVCPAKRYLVASIKNAKDEIAKQARRG